MYHLLHHLKKVFFYSKSKCALSIHQFLEVIISEPASFRPKDFSPDAEKSTPFMSCNRGISITITITVNS